ncbi:hypothetical protein BU15DRAFT_60659 [Melanogaster broomeanus]|nr:hypothetical protein BU15DRAFT_60659 [Melanogaster broomeanus]
MGMNLRWRGTIQAVREMMLLKELSIVSGMVLGRQYPSDHRLWLKKLKAGQQLTKWPRKRNLTAEVPHRELVPARTEDKQHWMVMTEMCRPTPLDLSGTRALPNDISGIKDPELNSDKAHPLMKTKNTATKKTLGQDLKAEKKQGELQHASTNGHSNQLNDYSDIPGPDPKPKTKGGKPTQMRSHVPIEPQEVLEDGKGIPACMCWIVSEPVMVSAQNLQNSNQDWSPGERSPSPTADRLKVLMIDWSQSCDNDPEGKMSLNRMAELTVELAMAGGGCPGPLDSRLGSNGDEWDETSSEVKAVIAVNGTLDQVWANVTAILKPGPDISSHHWSQSPKPILKGKGVDPLERGGRVEAGRITEAEQEQEKGHKDGKEKAKERLGKGSCGGGGQVKDVEETRGRSLERKLKKLSKGSHFETIQICTTWYQSLQSHPHPHHRQHHPLTSLLKLLTPALESKKNASGSFEMAQLMGHAGHAVRARLPAASPNGPSAHERGPGLQPNSQSGLHQVPSQAQSKPILSSIKGPIPSSILGAILSAILSVNSSSTSDHICCGHFHPLFTKTSSITCKEGQNLSLQVQDQESRTRSKPKYYRKQIKREVEASHPKKKAEWSPDPSSKHYLGHTAEQD